MAKGKTIVIHVHGGSTKSKGGRRKKQTAKQRAASLRNLKKARRARR